MNMNIINNINDEYKLTIKNILQNFKLCKGCQETKELTDFEKGRGKCKGCTKLRKKAFYKENTHYWEDWYKKSKEKKKVACDTVEPISSKI